MGSVKQFLAACILLTGVFFCAFSFSGLSASAASSKVKITLSDQNTLTWKGGKWYLKDKNGNPVKGIYYLNLSKARTRAADGRRYKGYYYFNKSGRLCTAKKLHKLNQKVGGVKFKGTYYFGGTHGALLQKKGWITCKGEKYYINKNGKVLTDRWKGNYYLLSDGTIAKSMQVPDGSWVDCDGKKCEAEEMALSGLKKTIASMTKAYGGTWSVYVKNLKTGDVLNYNECAMYPASTAKLFIMAAVYDRIKKGKLKSTSQIDTYLKNMITVSDNESANALVRILSSSGSFLDGASVVNKYAAKIGATHTALHHTFSPAYSSYVTDGASNSSSAKDCGLLLESIYKGTCVSKSYSKKMLNLLLAQTRTSKIPAGLPSGTKCANKTGEKENYEHDTAIVYGKKTDYVICVFTKDSGSAVSGIREVSRTVYNYLN